MKKLKNENMTNSLTSGGSVYRLTESRLRVFARFFFVTILFLITYKLVLYMHV